jgi:hypothetical protein
MNMKLRNPSKCSVFSLQSCILFRILQWAIGCMTLVGQNQLPGISATVKHLRKAGKSSVLRFTNVICTLRHDASRANTATVVLYSLLKSQSKSTALDETDDSSLERTAQEKVSLQLERMNRLLRVRQADVWCV